jgi:hypothetical protein
MWLLLVILLVFALAGAPLWPHSAGWGWGPSGIVGVILVVVLIMLLMGRL